MRIYIITLVLALVGSSLYGQSCDQATYYTEPANFTAEDEVTLYVDVSACSYLTSLDDIYLWIFVPNGPGPDGVGGNGDFCNGSNSNLQMTSLGDNLYSFTFTPTLLFDATPATIGDQIGFIPKEFAACKGNGDQTVDLFLTVDPSIFIATESRTFPAKFGQNDFVTLFYDQTLSANADMAQLEEIYVYTWVNGTDADGSDLGSIEKAGWNDVGTTEALMTMSDGSGVFSLTLKPEAFFDVPDDADLTMLNYIFRNAEGTVQSETFTSTITDFDN